MISIFQPSGGGQRLDPRIGLVQPWYTHGALDYIEKMELSGKRVLEWGGGCSTFWWAKRCAEVHTIEAHQDWANWIASTARTHGFDNIVVERRWPDPLDAYLRVPLGFFPDIVCIDGSERTACLEKALTLPRPLTIIVDNWQQDFVYIDERAVEMMKPYEGHGYFFVQTDHKDHQGRPWQTALWELP